MEARMKQIIATIEKMDLDKKNYARRTNYRIRKLRDLLNKIAAGENPDFIKEEEWEPKSDKDNIKQVETEKSVEAGENAIQEDKPETINYSQPIEIERDDTFITEIWIEQQWEKSHFMNIRNGDLVRFLDNGLPIAYNQVKYFQATSGIYKSETTWKHCIKAKYGYVPTLAEKDKEK